MQCPIVPRVDGQLTAAARSPHAHWAASARSRVMAGYSPEVERRSAFVRLAIAQTILPLPSHTKGVKDEGIPNRQLARVGNNLVRVINHCIARDTPGLVAKDSVAMLTGGLRIVAVAVVQGRRAVVGHHQILRALSSRLFSPVALTAALQRCSPERILVLAGNPGYG